MAKPINVQVLDNFVVIRLNSGKEVVLVGYAEGSDIMEIAIPDVDAVALTESPSEARQLLQVTVRYKDPTEMGLLKYRTVTAAPEMEPVVTEPKNIYRSQSKSRSRSAKKQSSEQKVDVIDDRTRDQVLNEIIESYVKHPDQSRKFTADLTKELAEKHGLTLFQVAGVRAALTKGKYGRPDDLIARFEKHGRI